MAIRHVNKVELVGKVIADPEFKSTRNGKRYATLRLVTEENRKNKDTGEWDRESEFHNIVVWKDEAVEEIENTVRKWCIVRIVGKKKTREYNEKYYTDIVVDNFGEFEFLEEPQERGEKKDSTPKARMRSGDGVPTTRKPTYTNNRPQDDEDAPPF